MWGDADDGSGGVTDEGSGRDGKLGDRDGERLSQWEDNLGKESNAPFAYVPGLEHHHLIMSMIGDRSGLLDIDKTEGVI